MPPSCDSISDVGSVSLSIASMLGSARAKSLAHAKRNRIHTASKTLEKWNTFTSIAGAETSASNLATKQDNINEKSRVLHGLAYLDFEASSSYYEHDSRKGIPT